MVEETGDASKRDDPDFNTAICDLSKRVVQNQLTLNLHLGVSFRAIVQPMSDPGSPSGPPQFGTAEYKSSPAGDTCKVCGQALPGIYYRANRAMVCGSCAERVRRELPQDSHAAFVRGIIFGIGGFAVGLALYAGFTILTGIEIGFVSLAVGWLVGKAVMLGSRGIGGRRYQIAAVVLTYAAVSMAYIPIGIHYWVTHKPAQPQAQPSETTPPGNDAGAEQQAQGKDPAPQAPPQPSAAAIVGKLMWFGLAAPFLQLEEGFSGVIGLVILLVGIQFAWRITAGRPRIVVDGPFDNSKPVAT